MPRAMQRLIRTEKHTAINLLPRYRVSIRNVYFLKSQMFENDLI